MRVLLISPNTLREPYPVYPLGLDYVAGAIAASHDVEIVDLNVVDLKELGVKIHETPPDVIGISCRNIDNTDVSNSKFFLDEYQSLVSWLRHQCSAVIVVGGSGFTIMPEAVLMYVGADYGVIGEGERFGLLLDALVEGGDPAEVDGVIASTEKKTVQVPQPWMGETRRYFREDLSHLPFYFEHGGMLNLQSKRGCRFRCIYCPYPAIEGAKQRLVEPAEVAQMALRLQESGAKYFFITDSAFNSDIAHSMEVARRFTAAGISIPWGAFFAPVHMDADYFKVMAEAGLSHAEFGTESLSGKILKSYRKPFKLPDVFRAHKMAREAGVHVAHYFLMGGPGESVRTVTETLDNTRKLDKTVFFFFFGIRIYPQTPLYEMALREGKIKTDTDLLSPVFYKGDDIGLERIKTIVEERLADRVNCIVGSGGNASSDIISRMHGRGFVGPLWEYLVR